MPARSYTLPSAVAEDNRASVFPQLLVENFLSEKLPRGLTIRERSWAFEVAEFPLNPQNG
jgi:hypothetical protein